MRYFLGLKFVQKRNISRETKTKDTKIPLHCNTSTLLTDKKVVLIAYGWTIRGLFCLLSSLNKIHCELAAWTLDVKYK